LPDRVHKLLAAEYTSPGDLIMAMKTEPDKVLALSGIGPKAMQDIEKAVTEVSFPAPVVEAEPEPEPAPEEVPATEAALEAQPVAEGEQVPEAVTPAGAAGVASAEGAGVAATETGAPAEAAEVSEEEAKEEPSLEELFKLRPETLVPASTEEAEEEKAKDKKGKKGKAVTLEYDEERGAVVGRKKHKREGGTWEEE
jgi:N utilization substance protein A